MNKDHFTFSSDPEMATFERDLLLSVAQMKTGKVRVALSPIANICNKMRTHKELIAEATKRPAVRAEIDRLEREEMPILDSILRARKDANMTQESIAKRIGGKRTRSFTP